MPDELLFSGPARPRPDRQRIGPAPALVVTAYGLPAPKGSKRHVGGGRMVESSADVKPWENAVASYAMVARSRVRGWRTLTGPIAVSMVFSVDRPRSHYGTGRNAGQLLRSAPIRPHVKPDLDKYARSTGDALTNARIYGDDALVVELQLSKHYTTDHSWCADVLNKPGCVISLWPLTAQGEQ